MEQLELSVEGVVTPTPINRASAIDPPPARRSTWGSARRLSFGRRASAAAAAAEEETEGGSGTEGGPSDVSDNAKYTRPILPPGWLPYTAETNSSELPPRLPSTRLLSLAAYVRWRREVQGEPDLKVWW